MTTPGKKRRRPVGETIGGIIVGFDQQIFRTMPPPHELVLKARPVRGLSGQKGEAFVVVFPGDEEPAPTSSTAPSEEASEEPPPEPEPEPDA